MSPQDRHADAGTGNHQFRSMQDLAAFLDHLHLFLGVIIILEAVDMRDQIEPDLMGKCGRLDRFAVQQLTGEMPLVLHGGTGIPADMIQKAISLGVSKINVNTECQLSFTAATRAYIEAGKDLVGKGFDPRKVLAPGYEAIKATVKEKIELFGSAGKA